MFPKGSHVWEGRRNASGERAWERSHGHSTGSGSQPQGPEPRTHNPGPTPPTRARHVDWRLSAPVEGLPATCPGRKPPHFADTAVLQ